MTSEQKPRTREANARLWGARAKDWAEIQEGACRPVYLAVFDRLELGPRTDYLDVGCGSGMAASIARERGAAVHGIDAASNLLEIAKARTPDGDFREGDIESLPFDDRSFAVVTGFNSFQYAGNQVASLREAARVAKPEGIVVIMTWGEPDGMEAAALVGALRSLLPPPPPGAPGPFALSEESAIRAFAESAGLIPREVVDVDCPWHYPNLELALRGLKSAGVAARAIEHSSESAVDEAHARALAPFRLSDGSFRVRARFRCLFARTA